MCERFLANLLLFHKLGVGAVVDDILAKNGSGKNAIDLLGAHVLEFSVENEVISRGADRDSSLLSKEDKGKNIAMLPKTY